MVYGAKASGDLNDLLDSDDSVVRRNAAEAMAGISVLDDGNDELMSCLYVVEKLAVLLGDDNYDTSAFADECLRHLCQTSSTASRRVRAVLSEPGETSTKIKRALSSFPQLGKIIMRGQ